MIKHRTIIDEVEKQAEGMDKLGSEIKDFCRLVEESIYEFQSPSIMIDIEEIPDIVVSKN